MIIKRFCFILLSIFFSTILTIIFLEILIRNFVDFKIDYYFSPKNIKTNEILKYPYGDIPINSNGFFDGEFDFKNNKIKIGYYGDSVTFGVGAGYPYRFTEYLDNLSPEFDHINLSKGLGTSLLNWNEGIQNFLIQNNIRRLVYVMNLNDIAPLSVEQVLNDKKLQSSNYILKIKEFFFPIDKILRGRSTLYTYLRFKFKNLIVKFGYEASGFKSIELYPTGNEKNILEAARKINRWQINLNNIGIRTCVVIIPYEMQISKDASKYYKSIGINFEDKFESFLTQKILIDGLLSEYNPYYINSGFLEKKIGYYYVYNKGDKIDFNHPNRNGHLVIAHEISKNKICQ